MLVYQLKVGICVVSFYPISNEMKKQSVQLRELFDY